MVAFSNSLGKDSGLSSFVIFQGQILATLAGSSSFGLSQSFLAMFTLIIVVVSGRLIELFLVHDADPSILHFPT